MATSITTSRTYIYNKLKEMNTIFINGQRPLEFM